MSLSEERLLALCAARFDGWRYEDETTFDFRTILRTLHTAPHLPPSQIEQQALLYFVHRYLTDWGGEREAYDSTAWQYCRALFLAVHDAPVPPAYCNEAAEQAWRALDATERAAGVAALRQRYEAVEAGQGG